MSEPAARPPGLLGQTVVILGGSSGIGLATARHARAEGADVIITGRDQHKLILAAAEVGALDAAAFDVGNAGMLERFFIRLPAQVDHIMLVAGGPYYAPLAEIDFDQAAHTLNGLLTRLRIAREAQTRIRPGGSLLLIGGTGARSPGIGLTIPAMVTAALPALTANLAVELAPVRANLIAPGFVDTPLSASLLGDQLETRREQLRSTLPIQRVVEPADVAALAVHLMFNTALTGATYDVDGGQQLVGA
jgi:NAD(P)-dependent dehydrogenase (short-subunit alcohol dehydrogenase family)